MGAADGAEDSWIAHPELASTAIDDASQTAQSNSLHEIEVLRPRTRPTTSAPDAPVEIVGSLWLGQPAAGVSLVARPDDVLWDNRSLSQLLQTIQLGGKRGYGFGRVRLSALRRVDSVFGIRESGPGRAMLPAGAPAPSHVLRTAGTAPEYGVAEPWVGREWRESSVGSAGQYIPPARVAYAPGMQASQSDAQVFEVGPYGVWTGPLAA